MHPTKRDAPGEGNMSASRMRRRGVLADRKANVRSWAVGNWQPSAAAACGSSHVNRKASPELTRSTVCPNFKKTYGKASMR